MKNILKSKIPNTVSFLAIIALLVWCGSVYAHDPDTYTAQLEQALDNTIINLNQCAANSQTILDNITHFQDKIFDICHEGGTIQAVMEGGEPVLFYCSIAIEM